VSPTNYGHPERLRLSLIVCTHNPRADYFCRVIEALKVQTLARETWELLLVDNACLERLENSWDLTWHPNARHIREDELGLTPAQLRGICEAQGSLLVFAHDDTVLAPDYLEQALRVEHEWPILGAWGGDVSGEFETQPESWTRQYLGYVGVRDCKEPCWSNNPDDWSAFPHGAGVCIRKEVASLYAEQQATLPQRRLLGRRGASLMSGEDIDLVLCSRQLGLGFGRFPQLSITHLIPTRRLTEDYLLKLVQAIGCSNVLLDYIHRKPPSKIDRRRPEFLWTLWRIFRQGRRNYRFHKAYVSGMREGMKLLDTKPT
jgi:glycosyltransferase involved in cell wall biosynthesis